MKTKSTYPLGHVLESVADNKINNGVCPRCHKWFGTKKLRNHLESEHDISGPSAISSQTQSR